MSWLCLQELVEEYSQDVNWAGEQYARLKSSRSLGRSSSVVNAMDGYIRSLSGTTSPPLTARHGAGSLTSSPVGSHARTYRQREKEQGSVESEAAYGEKWRELSVKYDPDTSSWKTAHSLFPEDLDWSSLTLPKWGMLRDGALWERTTQALPTAGKGAGLWATPTRRDYKDSPGMALKATNPDGSMRDRTDLLPRRVYSTGDTNGTLSPDRGELLMGWPMGWTSMEPLAELRVPTVEQWQDGTWEQGVPRVGVKIPDRVSRLKAIGNGQVPQAAAMAWEILSEEGHD